MKYTVLIATYNRADELRETLRSLAGLQTADGWEVMVVDNNSSDHTRQVVEEQQQAGFPVDLRYIFEGEQGKPAALNTGIRAARGEIIAFTDDDVRVEPDWLDQMGAGLARHNCDYVGGRVYPLWGGERPAWLPNRGGKHWAVIALLDYGDEPFELASRSPLGVNMGVRTEAFTRMNLWWDNRFGRQGGTLRGQEQREWCMRARAAGLRGWYVPGMRLRHVVPHDRLNKQYFRRWMYWNGISRAILYKTSGVDMESREDSKFNFAKAPHIAGVPRYMYRKLLRSAVERVIRRDPVESFENEMRAWFYLGVIKQRWQDRKQRPQQTSGQPVAAGGKN